MDDAVPVSDGSGGYTGGCTDPCSDSWDDNDFYIQEFMCAMNDANCEPGCLSCIMNYQPNWSLDSNNIEVPDGTCVTTCDGTWDEYDVFDPDTHNCDIEDDPYC